jgi:hypothetical protein
MDRFDVGCVVALDESGYLADGKRDVRSRDEG